MKLNKLLVLISTMALMACATTTTSGVSLGDSSSIETSDTSSSHENTTTNDTSSANTQSASNTDSQSSSGKEKSASSNSVDTSVTSNSSATSTNSQNTASHTLSFNFYNPTCGSMSTEVLNDRLKAYMNEVADFSFVSNISNTSCQVSANIPEDGVSVLIVGASSGGGELEFTLSVNIVSVTITAQTYHKPYTDYKTHELMPNNDVGSVCYVNTKSNVIDLAPINNEPVEKEMQFAVNGKKVKLFNEAAKNRALIKTITFEY